MAKMNSLIKKLRNTTIKIEFVERQVSELELNKTSQLAAEIKFWENHYNEKIIKLNEKIDNQDKNLKIRNDKNAAFKEKAYWQRRRFIQEHKNSDNKEQLLKDYDENQILELQKFAEQLLIKYPETLLTNEEKTLLNNKIVSLNASLNGKISNASVINEKRVVRITNKVNRLEVKKQRLIITRDNLTKEISLNNQLDYENKKVSIVTLETKIETLIQNLENKKQNIFVKKLKEWKLERAQKQLSLAKLFIEITDNNNIHLAVDNLKMHFGGIKALDGVSFNVKKGEIFGLIGPNGAGKTTVFNCITQFYTPTAGNILFNNKEGNITDMNEVRTHNIIKEGIARSFQNIEMVWELTVLDNLLVAAHSNIRSGFLSHMIHTSQMKKEEMVLRQKGLEILTMLGVEEYAFRLPYGLPYGILKKIELARTLMTNPTMIILDEPAAGLNDIETIDFGQTIKKINEELNVTIFLVEHDMQLVMSISNTVCAINFGKMLAIGTPSEIQNHEDVRRAYLGDD